MHHKVKLRIPKRTRTGNTKSKGILVITLKDPMDKTKLQNLGVVLDEFVKNDKQFLVMTLGKGEHCQYYPL